MYDRAEIRMKVELDSDFIIHRAQSTILGIFKVVTKICSQHQIPYYVIEGTLLGVVRHEGFIPWDDDIDIAVPTEVFPRFLHYMKCELPENMYLSSAFSEDKQNKETPDVTRIHKRNCPIVTVSGGRTDIWIDILQLVGMPTNIFVRKLHYLNILFKRIMVRISNPNIIQEGYWKNKSSIRKMIIKCIKSLHLSKLLSYKKRLRKLERCLKRYTCEESKYVMIYPSSYGEKEIFPKVYYGSGVDGEFEGIPVRLPDENHKILTALYGNYMQFPPEEKRKPTHVLHFMDDDYP